MRKLLALVAIMLVSVVACADYLNVIEPIRSTLMSQQTIRVGDAGPGQTFAIVADRASDGGNCVNNYCQYGWDQLVPINDTISPIPDGWEVQASQTQETPMRAKIKIGPITPDGQYLIGMKAVDEGNYDGLGNLTFYVNVTVTRDVFTISVDPSSAEAGVGEPAIYNVKITNTGVASDPFEISVKDGTLPAWSYKKSALVDYGSEKIVPYEVVLNEENTKTFTLVVNSLSSPLIHAEVPLVVNARSSIVNDWKATTHGLTIFPIILEPVYALMGLIGNLL